jgi:hypothetical protein
MNQWQIVLAQMLELDSADRNLLITEYNKVIKEHQIVEFRELAKSFRKTASVSMGPKGSVCPMCGR